MTTDVADFPARLAGSGVRRRILREVTGTVKVSASDIKVKGDFLSSSTSCRTESGLP